MSREERDLSVGAGDASFEESVFKTLSHQKRRDILRFIGERRQATFTEIKTSIGLEDSPSLAYHLNALAPLLVQSEGKYGLSELGRDTYNLMCKIATYSASTSIIGSLRREIPAVIISNAILWAAGIFSVSVFEGRLHQMTISSFAVLFFISNIILYYLSQRVRRS